MGNKEVFVCDECFDCECYFQNNDTGVECMGSKEKCHEFRKCKNVMTSNEVIEELSARYLVMSMCIDKESCKKSNKALDIAIKSIRESDKLKAEIDEWEKTVEYHRKKLLEFNNDNADLKAENEQLKSELEQSFRLPLTNAYKIRSMSDKELAEFLTRITNDAQLNVGAKCNYQWDEWLQSEV